MDTNWQPHPLPTEPCSSKKSPSLHVKLPCTQPPIGHTKHRTTLPVYPHFTSLMQPAKSRFQQFSAQLSRLHLPCASSHAKPDLFQPFMHTATRLAHLLQPNISSTASAPLRMQQITSLAPAVHTSFMQQTVA